jgi:hypothetical protein
MSQIKKIKTSKFTSEGIKFIYHSWCPFPKCIYQDKDITPECCFCPHATGVKLIKTVRPKFVY